MKKLSKKEYLTTRAYYSIAQQELEKAIKSLGEIAFGAIDSVKEAEFLGDCLRELTKLRDEKINKVKELDAQFEK